MNIYSEEMTERIEVISKEIDGQTFTGLRIYLELPTSVPTDFKVQGSPYLESTRDESIKRVVHGKDVPTVSLQAPFMHRPGDDDSSAVTFWGKQDLRRVLSKALDLLDEHYGNGELPTQTGKKKSP